MNYTDRYGIKSVTMDEIASQLGVSKKTIYHSFSDKNELVDAVIVDMINYNRECCQNDHKKSLNAIHEVYLAMEMLQVMFDNMNPSILFDIERNYPATFAKFKEYKYNFLFEMLKENIERGKKKSCTGRKLIQMLLLKFGLKQCCFHLMKKYFQKINFHW